MDTNPTPAPNGTEATPTNLNTPETTPAQPQTPAQASVDLGLSAEQAEQFKRFISSNGGFDTAFAKLKQDVSTPAQPAQPQPQPQPQPQSQPQPQPQPEPYKVPDGFVTQEELNIQRLFGDLARQDKYASISDQINNGDVLKEMAKLGMRPIDDHNNVNMEQLTHFLDLKAASVPAPQTTAPITNTPTVDYIEVGDNITNAEQAYQVINQSLEAKKLNQAPHPAEAKAREFLKTHFKNTML